MARGKLGPERRGLELLVLLVFFGVGVLFLLNRVFTSGFTVEQSVRALTLAIPVLIGALFALRYRRTLVGSE